MRKRVIIITTAVFKFFGWHLWFYIHPKPEYEGQNTLLWPEVKCNMCGTEAAIYGDYRPYFNTYIKSVSHVKSAIISDESFYRFVGSCREEVVLHVLSS